MSKLADQLRKAIEASGMTKYAISKASGVSQSTLSRFVRSEIDLTLGTAEKVVQALGIQIEVKRRQKRGVKKGR